MFYQNDIFSCSSLLNIPNVAHGFSSRIGGVSALPHTATMNLSCGLGDTDDIVRENLDIFAKALSNGKYSGENTVTAHQIHSTNVRILTASNAGEGFLAPRGSDCDGFVTDCGGIIPIARVADCVPVLLAGQKSDNSPVISAVHAGWRGTVAGICAVAVEKMCSIGCIRETIRVAIGAHIGFCCYEVGEDFADSVVLSKGSVFAEKYIRKPDGKTKFHADLTGMNLEILAEVGILRENIDVHPDCTMCNTEKYYSHRGMNGKRGVMGGGICIVR